MRFVGSRLEMGCMATPIWKWRNSLDYKTSWIYTGPIEIVATNIHYKGMPVERVDK